MYQLHLFSSVKVFVYPLRVLSRISLVLDRLPQRYSPDYCKSWSLGRISITMLYHQTSKLSCRLSIHKSKQTNLLIAIQQNHRTSQEYTNLNTARLGLLLQLQFSLLFWFLLLLHLWWLPTAKTAKRPFCYDLFQFKMASQNCIRREMIEIWDWLMVCAFYASFGSLC